MSSCIQHKTHKKTVCVCEIFCSQGLFTSAAADNKKRVARIPWLTLSQYWWPRPKQIQIFSWEQDFNFQTKPQSSTPWGEQPLTTSGTLERKGSSRHRNLWVSKEEAQPRGQCLFRGPRARPCSEGSSQHTCHCPSRPDGTLPFFLTNSSLPHSSQEENGLEVITWTFAGFDFGKLNSPQFKPNHQRELCVLPSGEWTLVNYAFMWCHWLLLRDIPGRRSEKKSAVPLTAGIPRLPSTKSGHWGMNALTSPGRRNFLSFRIQEKPNFSNSWCVFFSDWIL